MYIYVATTRVIIWDRQVNCHVETVGDALKDDNIVIGNLAILIFKWGTYLILLAAPVITIYRSFFRNISYYIIYNYRKIK